MSDPLFKMEKLNPNIKSGVPGAQPLREPSDTAEFTATFAPVLKVTRTETALTKGELKLQKDVAAAINPLYSQVFDDVIDGPHPRRTEHVRTLNGQNGNDKEEINTQTDSKKPKTKIPILNKFKRTADKVKDLTRRSKDNVLNDSSQENFSQRPRRSSIPKLKRVKKETDITKIVNDNDKTNNEEVIANNEEEEFEKIFEEIVISSNDAQDILSTDPKSDSENLESSFEEIIHAYDENKVQSAINNKPDSTKITPSKIPLHRYQNNEVKEPKSSIRRNSLKIAANFEGEKVKVKSIDFSKPLNQPVFGKLRNDKANMKLEENSNAFTTEAVDENISNRPLDNVEIDENSISPAENTTNVSNNDNIQQETKLQDQQTLVNEPTIEINNTNKDTETEIVRTINEVKTIEDNNTSEEIPYFQGKVNRLVSRLNSKDDPISHNKIDLPVNAVPKKKSVLSKVAIFELREPKPKVKGEKIQQQIPTETVKETIVCRKPKIIEEVLKPHVTTNISKDNDFNMIMQPRNMMDIQRVEAKVTDDRVVLQDNIVKYEKATIEIIEKHVGNDDNMKSNVQHVVEVVNGETESKYSEKVTDINKIFQKVTNHKLPSVESEIGNEKMAVSHYDKLLAKRENRHVDRLQENIIENRLRILQSMNELNNQKLKRSKSIVDLELLNTVKGKVHEIIEILQVEKHGASIKDVISARERPRRKSVSEKIAMFERIWIPVAMDIEAHTYQPQATSSRPADGATSDTNYNLTAEELHAKIQELVDAKSKYGAMKSIPVVELRNGRTMPVLAVGTALLDPLLIKHVIGAAIDLGYRAFDTAYIYGNELLVGEAIKAKIEEGAIKREELFIMSKLWSTFHRPDLVEKACRDSLKAMGLDYFDLYMIHNPMSFKEGGDPFPTIANVVQYSESDFMDAWFAMETLVDKRLVNSIGLSNFNSHQVARVYEKSHVKPVTNQVECHPYLSQERLTTFCGGYGVHIICYGTLGSKGTPADLKTAGVTPVIDDPFIQVMAAGKHISPGRMLIRYQLERGHSVVVKCSSAEHLWDNLQAVQLKLTPGEVEALGVLNKNKRNFSFKGMGDTHKNYPFKEAF